MRPASATKQPQNGSGGFTMRKGKAVPHSPHVCSAFWIPRTATLLGSRDGKSLGSLARCQFGRADTSTRYQTTRNGPKRAIDGITGLVHAPCQPPFTGVVTGGTKGTIFWRCCRQNLPSRLGCGAGFRPLSRRPTPSNSYFHGHGVGINGPGGLVD